MYTNADGLVVNGKELEFKDRIQQSKPDIVGVVETKLSKEIGSNLFCSGGYTVVRREREGKGGGGIALLIRDDIKFEEYGIEDSFKECIFGKITIGKTCIVVLIIYNPPKNYNDPEIVYNRNNEGTIRMVGEAAKHALLRDGKVLIMGDFNYKEIDWENLDARGNSESWRYKFIECIQENFLFQHVTEHTRIRGMDTPSVLDLILTNNTMDVENIRYDSPIGKSDHVVLAYDYVVNEVTSKGLTGETMSKRRYSAGNYVELNKFFGNICWEVELQRQDINKCYERFCEIYNKGIKAWIPLESNKKGKYERREAWFNKRCQKARETRDLMWRRYKRHVSKLAYERYKRARNDYSKIRQEEQRSFEKNVVDKAGENPKLFHKFIRSKLSVKEQLIRLRNAEGIALDDEVEICEELNDRFKSVFTVEDSAPPILAKWDGVILEDIEIDRNDIKRLLKGLDPHKASGPDDLSPYVLKACAETLDRPLEILFRRSLEAGVVPMGWKRANIVPIYKKGDREIALNYRPVSLTSVVCKILEKLIRKQMDDYLKLREYLSDRQHGFRERRSCVTNLLDFYERVSSTLDKRDGWVDCVFLDCQKAFDTVPHKRLIKKLEFQAGIRGRLLKWIMNYLEGREQRTHVRGAFSKWVEVTSGVPQGSVLGPILFMIYVNDLPEGLDSYINMFADDAKIMREVQNEEDCNILQRDLIKLQQWSDTWLMRFNPSKCKVMRMGCSENRPKHEYRLGESLLHESVRERDLGVDIVPSLSPEIHIRRIVKESNCLLANIKIAFKHMDKDMFGKLFKTYIRPKLEYASQVWSPHLKKHKELLERVQRRATKIVPEIREMSYSDRLEKLGLPTMEERRERGDLITAFKILNQYDDSDSRNFFERCEGRNTRGHNWKLNVKSVRKDVKKYFFSNRVVDQWNKLSNETVNADSIHKFKKMYDSNSSSRDGAP